MNNLEEKIEKLLADVDTLLEAFTPSEIEKLEKYYNTMEICANKSCHNVDLFDISYRVQLVQSMDKCLNILIDYMDGSTKITGHIYTPAVQRYRTWSNVELMKDKCLTGYMLSKELHTTNYQYFCDTKHSYPLATDLPDLEILMVDKTNLQVYQDHLLENYKKMDVLILHGFYHETIVFLAQYRLLRPDGKVYCALDLNNDWMNTIPWEERLIQQFFTQCDVVTTSCSSLRDKLNGNPQGKFLCRYLPNGFYNPTKVPITANFETKENTILTVGRIGSKQKNNEELVIGFSKIAHLLPHWKLKLVGTVENSFYGFLDKVSEKVPNFRNQVEVLGPLMDKKALYQEYAKAKIFALTSTFEGGTPNVYAEALFHGCKFLTSDIDAADDITNFGTLGETYHLGDLEDFSEKLLKLCEEQPVTQEEQHIQSALAYAQKEFDWERNAKKIAYTLFHPPLENNQKATMDSP